MHAQETVPRILGGGLSARAIRCFHLGFGIAFGVPLFDDTPIKACDIVRPHDGCPLQGPTVTSSSKGEETNGGLGIYAPGSVFTKLVTVAVTATKEGSMRVKT